MKDVETYIDLSLSSETCDKAGFTWLYNIVLNHHPLYGTLALFQNKFQQGYRLGKAKNRIIVSATRVEKMYGLYMPKKLASSTSDTDHIPHI